MIGSDLFTCSANGWIKVRAICNKYYPYLIQLSVGHRLSIVLRHGKGMKILFSHPSFQVARETMA